MPTSTIRAAMLEAATDNTAFSKPELGCTVSSLTSIRMAVQNGANAVYVPHHCAKEQGFECEVEYAQSHDCKVVLIFEEKATAASWDELRNTIHNVASYVDAVLLSDPALLMYVGAYYPGLPHYLQLSEWEETEERAMQIAQRYAGVERVVLPRIVFMSQAEHFVRTVAADVEMIGFGQCAFIDGQALNEQAFNKPCNDALDLLPRLINMGVRSVRIEGEDSGTNSIANVTRIWREAIDKHASRRRRLELIS